MGNEQWLIVGAAAGNFLLLLFGFISSGKAFKPQYLIDAFAGTFGALPTVQAIGFTPAPTAPWWSCAVLGLAFGLGIKVLTGKTLVKPAMQMMAKKAAG